MAAAFLFASMRGRPDFQRGTRRGGHRNYQLSFFDTRIPLAVIANLASNIGGTIQAVGAAWMMTSLGGSAQMITLVQTATSLPIMLLSLLAGALADSRDRRRVMLTAQLVKVVVALLIAAGASAHMLTPWLLLLLTFVLGCGSALNAPAYQASVGDIVPRPALPDAVALNTIGFQIARTAGPALGGLIVAAAGAVAAFFLNVLTFVGLIAVLLRWRPASAPRPLPPEPLGVAMASGVRYAAMAPAIRRYLARAVLCGFGLSCIPALMPIIARDLIAGGALDYGILLAGFGIGAVGGSIASRHLRRRFTVEGVIRIGLLIVVAGCLVTAFSRNLALSLVALAASGAGWVTIIPTLNIAVQMASPRWVVARCVALFQMCMWGGVATGSWAFGLMSDGVGPSTALLVGTAVQLLALASGLVWRLAPLSEADLEPRGDWCEPAVGASLDPRSGPILVSIEHRIASANVMAFLSLMNERRRIRRRNGARDWRLFRDLEDADLWVERFQFATWLDYVPQPSPQQRRHANGRQTRRAACRRHEAGRPARDRTAHGGAGAIARQPPHNGIGPRSPRGLLSLPTFHVAHGPCPCRCHGTGA